VAGDLPEKMIARHAGTPANGLPMKPHALFLLAALLAGCAPVGLDPAPPGMPLDRDFVPQADDSAVTKITP